MENLTLGSYGWDRDEWEDVFYPEDLPEDWRLDFYSNEFHCALVPQTTWVEWSEDDFEDIQKSIEGQRFAMYFAVDVPLNSAQEKQLLMCHQRFAGLRKGVVFFDVTPKLPSGCDEYTKTLVSQVDDDKTQLEGVWSWRYDKLQLSGDPLGYLPDVTSDGRSQADILKSFVVTLPAESAFVPFILGRLDRELEITDIRGFKVVAELLGF